MTGIKPIKLICKNTAPMARVNEPVTLGVPFSPGVLKDPSVLALSNSEGRIQTLQAQTLAQWPDGSTRWLLCDFFADVPAHGESQWSLHPAGEKSSPPDAIEVTRRDKNLEINTGAATYVLDDGTFRLFGVRTPTGMDLQPGKVSLIDESGTSWQAVVDEMNIEVCGPVRCTVAVCGGFRNGTSELLKYESRLSVWAGTARSQLEFRIHNPRAAKHPGGLWDLGDASSIFLRELALSWALPANGSYPCLLRPEIAQEWIPVHPSEPATVYQESSGGEHWDSPVHLNRDGRVPMRWRGYKVESGERSSSGLRAQPTLWWGHGAHGASIAIARFWQTFPKAMGIVPGSIRLALLPAEFPDAHEIQAGEQITHRIYLDTSTSSTNAAWGAYEALVARPELPAVCESGALPDSPGARVDDRYRAFLTEALEGETGFFAKRERVDEFGWRHFGELYADHESALEPQKALFVSHYNNQYDPLASFYREFLSSGDPRWAELAADLAAHLADIDIYHTAHDRPEYNHGLFWHTDHYLETSTATHRMASKNHLKHKNPAFCGGGPAAEHCYTTGLKLHYFLTGNPRYRDLVLRLADWCYLSLSGAPILAASLLRTFRSFSQWRQLRSSSPIWPKYPLTRGTGNCLNATLDALELSGKRLYLDRAAELVRNTVHPTDCVDERDLPDAETTWSYTVFLSSLARFLICKQERNEYDRDYFHARDSLLTYARWMAVHEYAYLDKPQILEYPNETWAAQDLRKSLVLFRAAPYAQGELRDRMIERCRFFLDKSFAELSRHSSRFFTRPLALVLQNGWVAEAVSQLSGTPESKPAEDAGHRGSTPHLTFPEVFRRSVSDIAAAFRRTSIRREMAWLNGRLSRGNG
jgi:hypothetical protein